MLKQNMIVPYLDTYLRSFISDHKNLARTFVKMSLCHRVIAHVFLRRHYLKQEPRGIVCMYDVLPFSPETIRRAVNDGLGIGLLEEDNWGDKRFKRIKASKLLVDCFEETHVESTD